MVGCTHITGMAFEDGAKKEIQEVGRKISIGSSLASMESLSMPLVCFFAYSILSFGHGILEFLA